MRQLIIDIETTGIQRSEGHRITEFCALEMIDSKLTGEKLHLYFNPERDIPDEIVKLCGYTSEDVAKRSPFRDHVAEIMQFM
jgi:DNA polymerase III subunit epsilon